MEFEQTIVFGDFHGDLDIMLASLEDKGLVRYDSQELDDVMGHIKAYLNQPFAEPLEAMVIPQAQPVRVIFLGDFLDRYNFGYHIIQLVEKIRWESFGIYPIFLLSNHDLLNFHFFINPYELSEIYSGSGHSKAETLSYVSRMGIDESLNSFKELHADEITNMQERFYETGVLEHQETGYTLRYQYPCDLSPLVKYRFTNDDYTAHYDKIVTEFGLDAQFKSGNLKRFTIPNALFNLLGEITGEQRNWWNISPKDDKDYYDRDYDVTISKFNLFIKEANQKKTEIFPIDWRVISLIWRHHYGNFFRRARLLHSEGTTVFVHGGISPLALVDPLVFGNIYDPRENGFKPLRSEYKRDFSLKKLINRSNRLVAQIVENALNDYSFRRMNGTELIDQMGFWRGSASGFPTFGGPIWSDFEYLQQNVTKHEKVFLLYQDFQKATGIERIVCGHSNFNLSDKPDVRFLMIKKLQEIGLEYLCVDNACSRGYRYEEPVLNGISIDKNGKILDLGEVHSPPIYIF
jgi:hypothetical protein